MKINDWLKVWRKEFPNSEFKATGEGMVIKSKGWKNTHDDDGKKQMPDSIVFAKKGKA